MRRKSILLQLYLSYLAIMLLALASINWYSGRSFRKHYLEQTRADLAARAQLIRENLLSLLSAGEIDAPAVDALCKQIGKYSAARITVILPNGKVAGDSIEDPAVMDNHLDRPEVGDALVNEQGSSTRYSYTLKKEMMYVAVPARNENDLVGVVRTAMPVVDINRNLFSFLSELLLVGVIVAVVAAVFSLFISRRITRPLGELKEGADRFAKGELGHKLAVSDSSEIGALADAMNRMASELNQKMHAIERQRNEQEAVFASMGEGVLAVDSDEKVINLNGAAVEVLGIGAEEARGHNIQEIVRNADLQKCVRQALSSGEVERDIVLRGRTEKFIHVRGTSLRDANKRPLGAVFVLSDSTGLRRLENVRRDFVANVSHELKTPITSIKGFVETLLEGALSSPDDTRQFLSIIEKQADRLNSLIDDLLMLARIEQEAEGDEVVLAPGKVHVVIEEAVEACAKPAAGKNITINVACPEHLEVNMNSALLAQAIINLIDNAIKYSEAGKRIDIMAEEAGVEILIHVRDEGCGVEEKHLARLFERFYRVDKSRSRKLGGTGLGLAIVKHIMQAHSGSASVTSRLGVGSMFSLHLPKNPAHLLSEFAGKAESC